MIYILLSYVLSLKKSSSTGIITASLPCYQNSRCYGPFAEDPAAPQMVRRGAQRMRLRPAGLGGGEGVWRSQKVRGLEAMANDPIIGAARFLVKENT